MDDNIPKKLKSERYYTLIGIILLLGIWEAISLIAGSFIVPSPAPTIQNTLIKLTESSTWRQILVTLFRVLSGFGLAFVAGIITGIIIGNNKKTERILRPTIILFQGMPPILWAIPLILIFGTGNLSPILVISLICFPLVTLNVAEGMKTEPKELREMLKIYAPYRKAKLKELTIPHLKPFILSSLKLGIVLGIKASVVAEFFGSSNGIGFEIEAAYQSFEVKNLFSWGIILILLIILFDYLLSKLHRITNLLTIQLDKFKNQKCRANLTYDIRENIYSPKQTTNTPTTIHIQSLSFSYQYFLKEEKFYPKGTDTITAPKPSTKNTPQKGTKILQNINMEVAENEIAVITGDSGIGKTTLLKLIAGILTPDSGIINTPSNIGFIFQDDRLLPWRTTIKNVAIPIIYSNFRPTKPICIAGFLLKEVGLGNDFFKYPNQLSGGMRKRASLARCFAKFPDAILMDEPFTGLHKEARFELWERLFSLLKIRNVPVIIVTHFPEDIPQSEKCTFYSLEGSPATLKPVSAKKFNR